MMHQGTRSSNDAALSEIYDAYFPCVYNYVFYRLLHREDTEDVVSSIFYKVCANIDSYDPDRASVYTWVMNIAKNTLIDHYRSKKKVVSTDELEEHGAAPSIDFDEQYRCISSAERRDIYRVLSSLPERERVIIYYKYFEGRKNSEIATELGLNASTVSTLVMRAKSKLRPLLQDYEED